MDYIIVEKAGYEKSDFTCFGNSLFSRSREEPGPDTMAARKDGYEKTAEQ